MKQGLFFQVLRKSFNIWSDPRFWFDRTKSFISISSFKTPMNYTHDYKKQEYIENKSRKMSWFNHRA